MPRPSGAIPRRLLDACVNPGWTTRVRGGSCDSLPWKILLVVQETGGGGRGEAVEEAGGGADRVGSLS